MPRKGANLTPEAAARNSEAIARWHSENLEKLTIGLRRGKRDAYKALASARNTSVSSLIQAYMDGECEKEGIPLPQRE